MGKSKVTVIPSRVQWGMYIWVQHNGEIAADDEGNIMNIEAEKGDLQAQATLAKAAKYYGFEDGKAVFQPRRRITDEELEEQRQRLMMGLIPDPLDKEAIAEEQYFARRRND